ncbi:Beta 1,3 glucanase/similar to BEC6 and BEC6-2 [Blumeria hordei DH14]|uniref:Probable glucan endo-1,3-beta-glucosidase eglC n=1 Tax=Blumeria graminis f. sp. hordei (strain DH14) TaxID=546991 RepID=N1J7D5_BLUG1|nr:Beta 1,3 glucanase/similar to BEC6 and BEC6-2 [Blumeria hordei DH14]
MRLTTCLVVAISTGSTNAYWKGFNAQANKVDGSCKTQADWTSDFNILKSFPGNFNSIRLYASSDCNTLANAVPAAIATGIKVLAGVWTQNENHFEAEKQELLTAVQKYGFDWIAAVSVGSEDLYRAETTPNRLAEQIYDVRGMLSTVPGYSSNIQVGHVDTWTAWVNNVNIPVIKACDFIGTDGYPYFQTNDTNSVQNGNKLFQESLDAVRNSVAAVGSGAWVWVTESGWPTTGNTLNQAVPSIENAQLYWKTVACPLFSSAHTFWYSLQDVGASPSFGVLDANGKPQYDLSC